MGHPGGWLGLRERGAGQQGGGEGKAAHERPCQRTVVFEFVVCHQLHQRLEGVVRVDIVALCTGPGGPRFR